MPPYFPRPYPDELLYSVLARYCRHICVESPKRGIELLFGCRNVRVNMRLQPKLGELSLRLPNSNQFEANNLAVQHTLFNYEVAFQPENLRRKVLATLVDGECDWVHVRLGLVAGVVRPPRFLRFCVLCNRDDMVRYGEFYWHRGHQMPGVLVCHQHLAPLLDSTLDPAWCGQHAFVAADIRNCHQVQPVPSWANDPRAMALLSAISEVTMALLCDSHEPVPNSDWGKHYRNELRSRGFGKGNANLNQAKLLDTYIEKFEPIFDLIPESRPGDWLLAITRKHRKAFHPLRHILLNLLLKDSSPQLHPKPFGDGPWPCLNPLAGHWGKAVIQTHTVHRDRGVTMGHFSCECGFKYSQSAAGGLPRILKRGILFDVKIRELVASGHGLRATARILKVDTNTVLHHAARLALATPWKNRRKAAATPRDGEAIRQAWAMAHQQHPWLDRTQLRRLRPDLYAWLHRNDRDWLIAQPPTSMVRATQGSRLNWPSIDKEMDREIHLVAEQIRAESPPVRVTTAEIEKRLNRRGWFYSRRGKLPMCVKSIDTLQESLEFFQCRRVLWAARILESNQTSIKVWKLRRLAGLKKNVAPVVEMLLMACEVRGAGSAYHRESEIGSRS